MWKKTINGSISSNGKGAEQGCIIHKPYSYHVSWVKPVGTLFKDAFSLATKARLLFQWVLMGSKIVYIYRKVPYHEVRNVSDTFFQNVHVLWRSVSIVYQRLGFIYCQQFWRRQLTALSNQHCMKTIPLKYQLKKIYNSSTKSMFA